MNQRIIKINLVRGLSLEKRRKWFLCDGPHVIRVLTENEALFVNCALETCALKTRGQTHTDGLEDDAITHMLCSCKE
jgi:hypothetical protein